MKRMFEEIYHDYLLHKNEVNVEERYKGNEGWYHASGAGLCSRKLYYESVEKVKMPSKKFSELDHWFDLPIHIPDPMQNVVLLFSIHNIFGHCHCCKDKRIHPTFFYGTLA